MTSGGPSHPSLARGGPLGEPAPVCTHEQSQPRMGLAHLSGQLTQADHILKLPPDQGFLCQEHNSQADTPSPREAVCRSSSGSAQGGMLEDGLGGEERNPEARHRPAKELYGAQASQAP